MSLDIVLDFSLDGIKKYFKPKEWEKLSEYEKNKYVNVYSNYMHMLADGFEEAPRPEFMNIKPIFASDTESSSDSEYYIPIKKPRLPRSHVKTNRGNQPSTSKESERRYPKRNVPKKNYEEEEIIIDDRYVYCAECMEDWVDYCKIHGDLIIIEDNFVPIDPNDQQRALKTTPYKWMAVKPSRIAGLGVWSTRHIPDGIRFGPYEGKLIPSSVYNNYSWQLRENGGKGKLCIDAGNPALSNWMRYVNCARNQSEQNLLAYQYMGHIYYRTLYEILPHTELLVWYGPSFARQLGIDVKMYNIPLKTPFPEKVFNCAFCRNSFSSPMYLEEHVKRCTMKEMPTYVKGETFICNYCRKGFSTSDFCKQHAKWCRNRCKIQQPIMPAENTAVANERLIKEQTNIYIKKHICTVCSNPYPTPAELARHMLVHTVNKPHKCTICKDTFTHAGSLKQHMLIHTGAKTHVCTVCSDTFTQLNGLNYHMATHTGDRTFKCTQCDKAFTRLDSLTEHMRYHTGDKPYKCTLCDKAFKQSGSLTVHMRCHTGDKPYKCTQCDRAFTKSSDLTRHMRCHTGDRPYKCTQCYKAFTDSSHLIIHMRCHTGDKPYTCTQCDKAFTKSSDLTRHTRCHTGDKPYKCTQCGKTFTESGGLTVHMRGHTGDKSCKCTQCNKAFTQSGDLTKHMRCHTGDKPYKCTQCDKAFTNSSDQTKHMRCHTGDKPYKCTQCDKAFTRSGSLTQHMLVHIANV